MVNDNQGQGWVSARPGPKKGEGEKERKPWGYPGETLGKPSGNLGETLGKLCGNPWETVGETLWKPWGKPKETQGPPCRETLTKSLEVGKVNSPLPQGNLG